MGLIPIVLARGEAPPDISPQQQPTARAAQCNDRTNDNDDGIEFCLCLDDAPTPHGISINRCRIRK